MNAGVGTDTDNPIFTAGALVLSSVAAYIPWRKVGIAALILIPVIVLIVVAVKKNWFGRLGKTMSSYPTPTKNAQIEAAAIAELAPLIDAAEGNRRDYKESLKGVPADETALSNFYVLGARLTGYLGPEQENGVYSARTATVYALRAGARVLVLEIDYLDAAPATPVLVCRDAVGRMSGNNTGLIKDVATGIAEFKRRAFSPGDPIIVVLNVVRLPGEPGSAAALQFMERIAAGLEPIYTWLLRQTASGSFLQQKMEDVLFRQRVQDLENKIVLLTTADTRGFRDPPPSYKVSAKANLDNLVHARLYGSAEAAPQGVTPGAYFASPAFYADLPTDRVKTYSDGAMKAFHVALTAEQMPALPTEGRLGALKAAGVQCVPVSIFDAVRGAAAAAGEAQPIFSAANFKQLSFVAKPESLRYKEPKAVTVSAPPANRNAGGGRIVLA